jgi:acetolactate synthase-1/2/3 large subunit
MFDPQTGAELLVRRLYDHGVRHVFGYPGGQLTPVYDALSRQTEIRHYLARHEQAAAFMADGFARATRQPGVCLAVCGPGVLNAATPLATAYTDSIPVLLISGQIPTKGRGLRSGYYHENDQQHACTTLTKWRTAVDDPALVVPLLDEAFQQLRQDRPGPVLFDVPLDLQRAAVAPGRLPAVQPFQVRQPDPRDIKRLAETLAGWKKPLLLAGGGVVSAGAEPFLAQLATRLGAPVFHTFMGKCALSSEHPLKVGLPWSRATSDLTDMASYMSPLFAEADGLLAIGCRFTQATTGSYVLEPPEELAQIDVDPKEISRHYRARVSVVADARAALEALLDLVPSAPRVPWARPQPPAEPFPLEGLNLVGPLRRVLPRDAIVVADITRLGYILLATFPVHEPRTLLHPAGYVAMGYGIPAALGAKAALPRRTVVAVVGDGCFQMCGMELATAVQEKLPILVVVVNDGSLTLIKAIQDRRYQGRHLGVDLRNPDFQQFAAAFGVRAWRVTDDAAFERALAEAVALDAPALVEVVCRG